MAVALQYSAIKVTRTVVQDGVFECTGTLTERKWGIL